jgi:hypothetical protein
VEYLSKTQAGNKKNLIEKNYENHKAIICSDNHDGYRSSMSGRATGIERTTTG